MNCATKAKKNLSNALLAFRQLQPIIGIQSGGGHSGERKPNACRCERVKGTARLKNQFVFVSDMGVFQRLARGRASRFFPDAMRCCPV